MGLSHLDLAKLAKTIYSQRPDVTMSRGLPYQANAFFYEFGAELVVISPGTYVSGDLSGWIRDLDAVPERLPMIGTCHKGFGKGGLALWPSVLQYRPSRTPDFVTFAGHSLGGALASVLAAVHSVVRPTVPFRIVTFGEPRVAAFWNRSIRAEWGRAYEDFRYRRDGDPVPHVPPWPLYRDPDGVADIGKALDPLHHVVTENHSIDLYIADIEAEQGPA